MKDRVAAHIHWQDRQSLIQVTAIILNFQLSPNASKHFCEREGIQDDYVLRFNLISLSKSSFLVKLIAFVQGDLD